MTTNRWLNNNGKIASQAYLPVRTYDLSKLGREMLAAYCIRMCHVAKQQNNFDAYFFYQQVSKMVAHETTGMILGTLLFEARLIVKDETIFDELPDSPPPVSAYGVQQGNTPTPEFYNKDTIEVSTPQRPNFSPSPH